MKKSKQILTVLFLAVLVISTLCVPAFALDESEVEAAVAASGKEAVTGNVLIWFLCAVAFLKVSQKIDSFMATLGGQRWPASSREGWSVGQLPCHQCSAKIKAKLIDGGPFSVGKSLLLRLAATQE